MMDVRLRVRFFTPGVRACFEQLRRERVEPVVVVEFPRCDRAETGVAAAVQRVVLALLECAAQRDLDVLRSAV